MDSVDHADLPAANGLDVVDDTAGVRFEFELTNDDWLQELSEATEQLTGGPVTAEEPISDAIDPDAVSALLDSAAGEGDVESFEIVFEYNDHTVILSAGTGVVFKPIP